MAVHESTRARDLRFVAKTMRDNNLKPWPIKGWYNKLPSHWSDGVRTIQLEQYEWGTVAFVTDDEEPKWAATLVLIGQSDWSSGVVIEDGRQEPIPIPWISKIDFEAQKEAAMPKSDDSLPECLAMHEHGPTCDGGLNTTTGNIEEPCLWRSRCYALKLHLLEEQMHIDAYLDTLPDPTELHSKLAEIERAKLHVIPPPAAEALLGSGIARGTQSTTKKKPGRKKKRTRSPDRFKMLEPVVKAFLLRLKKLMGRLGYGWAPKRSFALPGDCYVHRVTKHCNYLVIYVASKGKYGRIAILKFKTWYKCIDIGFRSTWDDALAVRGTTLRRTSSQQAPVEWHGIRDRKTARRAAKVLAKMVKSKAIELPPPRRKSDGDRR
jgi:hypothetical protein